MLGISYKILSLIVLEMTKLPTCYCTIVFDLLKLIVPFAKKNIHFIITTLKCMLDHCLIGII